MNVIQKGIVTLLRSAITGEVLALPEGFDIAEALPLIKKHYMVTLIYDGAVRCGISGQHPVMQQLFAGYCRAMLVSEGQMREIDRICAAFEENGIDCMLLKGSRMKALYPKPELRLMGDADILIRMEQYGKIEKIMESLGFEFHDESDHELVWNSKALHLELHKRVIPSYNQDYYAYFGDGWKLAERREGSRHYMSREDEWIYMFTHFAKHYRDGGIGCRHVVDIWVYLRNNPDMDDVYIRCELRKLGLDVFYGHVCTLIGAWFEDGSFDEKTEFISEFIFSSGSFGEDAMRVLSRAVRDRKHSVLGFSGRLSYIVARLFPSAEFLSGRYTILKKCPWTLPLVWIIRPFYKVLSSKDALQKQMKEIELIKSEDIDLRQKALNFVGLDYNF